MKALVSMKNALKYAQSAVGDIHSTPNRCYWFYAPFDIEKPCGATTPVKSLYYGNALIKRKIEVLCQALWFLGYNQGYIENIRVELECTRKDIEQSVSELLSKYNIGLTVDTARKDVIELNNLKV